MQDAHREATDLKREIVDTRNQSIKTNNQIKNLALDVKGFEKRFDELDRRTKLSNLGVHAVIALSIAIATGGIATLFISSSESNAERAVQEAEAVKKDFQGQLAELRAQSATDDQNAKERQSTASAALAAIKLLEQNRPSDAAKLFAKIKLERLTPLERHLAATRLTKLKSEAAAGAFRNGKRLRETGRKHEAIAALRQSLELAPGGGYAGSARYLLGITLRETQNYKAALEVFASIQDTESDQAVLDEIRYWQGYSLVRMGQANEAQQVLTAIANAGGRHANAARSQLAALMPPAGSTE